MQKSGAKLHSGLVWIFSGCLLLAYGILGLTNTNVPGAEELVAFANSAEGNYLYLAAFVSVFIEGIYVLGSFFPGSSLVLLIAVISQAGGTGQFLGIIGTVYVGWLLAGLVNVFGAKYFFRTLHIDTNYLTKIEDNTELTWFPAFRANTEVAQIIEGHKISEVLLSSWRVKTYACVGAAAYALVIPFLIDIQNVSNKEGFLSLGIIAFINFNVGGYKIYQFKLEKIPNTNTS